MKPFDTAQTAAALVTNKSIISLVEQLKNRIKPQKLKVYKTPQETSVIINKHLNKENLDQLKKINRLKNENSRLKSQNDDLTCQVNCARAWFCF